MKAIQTITLSLLSAAMIASCNSPSASVAVETMTSPKAIATSGVVTSSMSGTNTKSSPVSKGAADNISAAKTAGKAVFLVVTGTGVTETDKAMLIAKGANDIYKNSVIVQINRDDASNAQLVSEYRLAGAPLPLILVISSKGFPTGGYILAQATAENLAALIPSPKLEDVYATIRNSKTALVVFTKKSLSDRAEVIKVCKDAVSKLNNNAVIVEVDMDDSKEASFMNQLHIDKSLSASLTLVINTQGQVAGTSTTVPDAAKLALAATTPVAGGCGPGCGPSGCGK